MSDRRRADPKRKPARTAARSAAWREVLRSRTPARRTPARALLDALILDAMLRRLEVEVARTFELAGEAGKQIDRAITLVHALEKRSAELDQLDRTRGALMH
jgi:hypothetical protein